MIASIILVVIIILLYIIQRAIQKRTGQFKEDKNIVYKRRLEKISQKINTGKTLSEINKLAREYFEEAFGIDTLLDYSEIKIKLNNKTECKKFCELMVSAKYSGKNVDKKQVKVLITLLGNIIKNNPIKNPRKK
jgi:hypothetical protein